MVVGVRAVAAVKSLEQVVDAVVVVVKVVKVVDAVVIVVAGSGLFKEGGVRGDRRFQHGEVDDDTGGDAGVGPHQVGQGVVSEVDVRIMGAVPSTLTALVRGLNRRHAQAAALHQLGVSGSTFVFVNGLNDGEQRAGQHQKDDDDRHGESLSLFDSLSVLF